VASSGSSHTAAISLDELIALNDEIAALVRSGVPLEGALSELGEDLPGRLGRITQMIAVRMKRGESLADILEKEQELFPPIYRAVVLAGLRAGRLSAALESVSRSARRLADTQRMTAAGFLYPILVVLVAWCMGVFLLVKIIPVLLGFLGQYGVEGPRLVHHLARWGYSVGHWWPVVPVAIVLLAGLWWFRSSRAALLQPRSSVLVFGWLPWLGRMLRWHRIVTFSEVLALLIENGVPLAESVVLSAEATGDRRMIRAAKEIAEALERGQSLAYRGVLRREFPPLLHWLMLTGQSRGALLPALRHAAETYERRARHQADVARVFVPVLLTAAIGGTVTLCYALMLFVPWTQMLRALSVPGT